LTAGQVGARREVSGDNVRQRRGQCPVGGGSARAADPIDRLGSGGAGSALSNRRLAALLAPTGATPRAVPTLSLSPVFLPALQRHPSEHPSPSTAPPRLSQSEFPASAGSGWEVELRAVGDFLDGAAMALQEELINAGAEWVLREIVKVAGATTARSILAGLLLAAVGGQVYQDYRRYQIVHSSQEVPLPYVLERVKVRLIALFPPVELAPQGLAGGSTPGRALDAKEAGYRLCSVLLQLSAAGPAFDPLLRQLASAADKSTITGAREVAEVLRDAAISWGLDVGPPVGRTALAPAVDSAARAPDQPSLVPALVPGAVRHALSPPRVPTFGLSDEPDEAAPLPPTRPVDRGQPSARQPAGRLPGGARIAVGQVVSGYDGSVEVLVEATYPTGRVRQVVGYDGQTLIVRESDLSDAPAALGEPDLAELSKAMVKEAMTALRVTAVPIVPGGTTAFGGALVDPGGRQVKQIRVVLSGSRVDLVRKAAQEYVEDLRCPWTEALGKVVEELPAVRDAITKGEALGLPSGPKVTVRVLASDMYVAEIDFDDF